MVAVDDWMTLVTRSPRQEALDRIVGDLGESVLHRSRGACLQAVAHDLHAV